MFQIAKNVAEKNLYAETCKTTFTITLQKSPAIHLSYHLANHQRAGHYPFRSSHKFYLLGKLQVRGMGRRVCFNNISYSSEAQVKNFLKSMTAKTNRLIKLRIVQIFFFI